MTLPNNLFTTDVSETVIKRINQLKPTSQPDWGKMNVAQMLAHCNVTYEMAYDNKASLSFGNLSKNEWNAMFYKHLDHHLGQFGV